MTSLTEAQALEWVANLFAVPPDSLTLETSRNDIVMWDSLGVLMILASLDEEFGINVTDAEMRTCTQVRDLVMLLNRHGKIAA